MADFEVEQLIPSTKVDIALLRSLETIIRRKYDSIMASDKPPFYGLFEVSIISDDGTERIASIYDYAYTRLPGDTNKVLITASAGGFSLVIKFGTSKTHTFLRVKLSGDNAKPEVLGLVAEIRSVVKNNAIDAWVHAGVESGNTIMGSAFVGIVALVFFHDACVNFVGQTPWDIMMLLLICNIAGGYFQTINTFCLFDSPAADSRVYWNRWLIGGMLGFVLFGTVLTFFRRQLFGF